MRSRLSRLHRVDDVYLQLATMSTPASELLQVNILKYSYDCRYLIEINTKPDHAPNRRVLMLIMIHRY